MIASIQHQQYYFAIGPQVFEEYKWVNKDYIGEPRDPTKEELATILYPVMQSGIKLGEY